jgi:hypothetical protein
MDDTFECTLKCIGDDTLAIPFILTIGIVQAWSLFLKWKFKEKYKGFFKLTFVYSTTLLVGVVLCKVSGLDWKTAIVEANLLAYAQVFGHQVFKNVKEYAK